MSTPACPGTQSSPPGRRAGTPPVPIAVVVMGVSGVGKSTLGKRLATALGGTFVEGDLFHDAAAIASMRAGRPLTDADRWPWLDRIAAAMRDAMAKDGVAIGACSALKRAYRDRLGATIGIAPRFVYLHASPDELRRRLEDRPGHYMPASLLASQFATLEPPTATECVLTLDAADGIDRLCRDTIDWLENAG